MEDSILFKKIYGCILGFCIGDAMGGPVEGMPIDELKKKYGRLTTFLPYEKSRIERGLAGNLVGAYALREQPGIYTDDGRSSLMWVQAMIRKGGKVDYADVADTYNVARFDDSMLPEGPERIWAEKCYQSGLRGGYPGWNFSGMALGLINAGDPEQAALDAGDDWTVVWHGDGLYAAAIAEAMKPGATMEAAIDAALRYGNAAVMTGWDVGFLKGRATRQQRAVERCIEVAKECKDVWELRDRWDWKAEGFTSLAFGMFYRAGGDPVEAILGGVNAGDDTVPHFSGGMAGALMGVDAIPPEWIEIVEKANPVPDLRKVAQGMTEVVEKRLEQLEKQKEQLETQIKTLRAIV